MKASDQIFELLDWTLDKAKKILGQETMKIDCTSLKAFNTELPAECSEFIANLRNVSTVDEFVAKLDKMTEWYSALGKIEMGRFAYVLNDCDEILEVATKQADCGKVFIDYDDTLDCAVISVLRFTSLLFENSFSRSVYSSMDRLLKLLDCRKMFIVVQTLRLLLVISKSSRYITQHVQYKEKKLLYMKLTANTECWSGKLRSLKMKDCCQETIENIDFSSITYRTSSGSENFFVDINSMSLGAAILKLQERLVQIDVDESEAILAFTKLRLIYNFSTITSRFQCIMARLISISVLFYSRCLLDEWRINCLVNDDVIEQICALLQLEIPQYSVALDTVKTEAMKTLASVVFLEKPRKINLVVDCLGLNSYHGFTPSLLRTCLEKLKGDTVDKDSEYSNGFITALFSLIYHIAGFDYGGESLISSSIVSTFLVVVKPCSLPDSQISFVTRAVRIIDILTGIDVSEFTSNDGMNIIVDRFVYEVELCKKQLNSSSSAPSSLLNSNVCHQQRAALMKSLLNFLKRAVADTNYASQVRRIMEADLPKAIVYIIENPEFFGSSLLHCAIHLTTSFIYQEPAQLTFLQDNGLTEAMLKSLFNENFPVSKDIITGLPNICTALCLNERGLKMFNEYKPLDRIFRIIFSTKFIFSLRKRKTEMLEAAASLGSAFDELMRHQPTLRRDVMVAFAQIMNEIFLMGSMSLNCVISWHVGKAISMEDELFKKYADAETKPTETAGAAMASSGPDAVDSTSEESLNEKEATNAPKMEINRHSVFQLCYEHKNTVILPLGDYLGMIGALLEAILTHRSAQENSNVMLECSIPSLLIKLLTVGKPYQSLLQSTYLHNLANIIRQLMTQSNKIDPFEALVNAVSEQLTLYSNFEGVKESSKEFLFLLTKICALAFVVATFMKISLSNVHDTRSLLLIYFSTNEKSQCFMQQLFETFCSLNLDLLRLNKVVEASNASPKAASTDSQQQTLPPPSTNVPPSAAASTSSNVAPGVTHQQKLAKKNSDYSNNSLERILHSTISRLHKQLSEVIVYMGKTFFTTFNRPRRSFENVISAKDSCLVAGLLFKGVSRILKLDECFSHSDNWSSVYAFHALSILKKLIFDDYQGHAVMLPFFYKTGCHLTFFELGEFLVLNSNKDIFYVAISSWLSIAQRLVCANNVLNAKNRSENAQFSVVGFESKKYLALCQQDALKILQQLFKSIVGDESVALKEEKCKLLDKVIMSMQVLVRSVVQLNESEKNSVAEPEMDVLINEIDTEKVQQLVEMGFSQSDAVDALLHHTSVPEAAEYLISLNDTRTISSSSRAAAANIVHSSTNSILLTPAIAATNSAPISVDDESSAVVNDEVQPSTNHQEYHEEHEQMDIDQASVQVPATVDSIKGEEEDALRKLREMKLISFKETLDTIFENIVPDCIRLIERDHALVFSVSELLSVFSNNLFASNWMQNVLVKKLLSDLENIVVNIGENSENFEQFDQMADKFASLLHLFCLLWQVFDNVKLYSLLGDDFCKHITDILFLIVEKQKKFNARLIPSILLCIDMYEKEKRIDLRQKLFSDFVEHVQWYYWINERFGTNNEWRNYTPAVCATLNRAFREGKSSMRIVVAEKNVVVDFIDMTQRPVDVPNNAAAFHPTPVYAETKLKEDFTIDKLLENERVLRVGDTERCKRIICCLLKLLQPSESPLSNELVYSSLSLLMRLICMEKMRDTFIENDGVETLLSLECTEKTVLMSTAVTLILRMCIDDDETLTNAYTTIIHGVESGFSTSLSELSTRIWLNKSKRQQKEWRRILRFLSPLASRNPSVFIQTMKKNVVVKDGEIALAPTAEHDPQKPTCGASGTQVLKTIVLSLIGKLVSTDFSKEVNRVLRPNSLLKMLSELLRSYFSTATFLVEETYQERTVISWIIDNCILNTTDTPEIVLAAKSVFINLVSCPTSGRANEIIVNEIKTLLSNAVVKNGDDKIKLCSQVSALGKLILLLRETAQSSSNANKARDLKQAYSLIRYVHRKNLIIDFAKCIWYLPLNEKCANETIGIILRVFESISRDLIAINSVRNATATSATASATAAAAIAAATAAASSVQSSALANPLSSSSNTAHTAGGVASTANSDVPSGSTNALSADTTSGAPAVRQLSVTAAPSGDSTTLQSVSSLNDHHGRLNDSHFHTENADNDMSELSVSQVLASIDMRSNGQNDNHSSNDDESQSSVSEMDESNGSESDGGGELQEDEDNSEDDEDDMVEHVPSGSRRRHREMQLDAQVRTSTPISEDELDHHHEDVAMIMPNQERVIIGDEETDETQRDDEDEELNEEVDEEDAIEFEDALTDYLDVTYVADRNNGFNPAQAPVHLTGFEFYPPPIVGVNGMFGGNVGGEMFGNNWLNEFELLAASAGYVAGILTRFPGANNNDATLSLGIPIEDGLDRSLPLGDIVEFSDTVQHPLLRRPPTVGRLDGTGNVVVGQNGMNANAGTSLVNDNYRFGRNAAVFGGVMNNELPFQRIMANRFSGRTQAGLRRQGALRRWNPMGGVATNIPPSRAAHRFLSRLFDESLFPDMHFYRHNGDNSREIGAERRVIDALVPYYLDRIFDQARLLDAHSIHYISLIIATYLTKELVVHEEAEEFKNNENAEDVNVSISDVLHNDSEVALGDLEPSVSVQQNNELATLAVDVDEDERRSADESIDSSELSNRLAVLVPTAGESEENTRDCEMPLAENAGGTTVESRSTNFEDARAEETEAAEEHCLEDCDNTAAPGESPQGGMTDDGGNTNAQEGDQQPPTSNSEPNNAEDFSAILGEIEIPEGVDPAFLAALPEDIRQEVIRDHLRQQRAQRINQAQQQAAVAAAAVQSTTESAASTSDVANQLSTTGSAVHETVDEVLDQEFLAALPPELQEEVLAQHEQRLAQRNRATAIAAVESGNAGEAAPVDINAVFESLPPGLRAQVLADADDSVLQILPPNLLAEANRLRANFEQQQVFRFSRMMDRDRTTSRSLHTVRSGGGHHPHPHYHHPPPGISGLGIDERGVQIFDRESIVTLLLLYFLDHEKFCLARLQKLLKPLCLHSGTCDYVVWSLISMLNVLNNVDDEEEDINFSNNGWIDGFQTQTALNQSDHVLRLKSSCVKVHQLVRTNVCLRILDTLIFLARNFPQHFLPNKIRNISNATKRWDPVPDINAFWDVVRNINRKPSVNEFKPSVKALTQFRDIIPPALEQSPMAFLLNYSSTDVIKSNSGLMDKVMKILQITAQSVPSDSQSKLTDSSVQWLSNSLQELANLILDVCSEDGLKDGRMFFVEILRILPSQRSVIFTMLYKTVKEQGKLLEEDIRALLVELEQLKKNEAMSKTDGKLTSLKPNVSQHVGSVASTSDAAGTCASLSSPTEVAATADAQQLVTLKAFSARNSQPKKFLKSLETISYLRNQLKQSERRKRNAATVAGNAQNAGLSTTTTVAPNAVTPSSLTAEEQHQEEPAASSAVTERAEALQAAAASSLDVTAANVAGSSKADVFSAPTADDYTEERDLEDMLEYLDPLWKSLSDCLEKMSLMLDSHAVLSLQHAAEAFFLAHAFTFSHNESAKEQAVALATAQAQSVGATSSPSTSTTFDLPGGRSDLSKYTQEMFQFAEKHRTVLNQILRGNTNNLMEDSAFAILTYFPKLLDFDVKRKFFYKEIRKLDDRSRHEDVAVRIRRNHLFSDSFRELFRLKSSDWKARFYIIFEGEEGQDAGGLLREWYSIITREVFNPNYALFITAPGDRVTYMINKTSYINPEHLDYFKFVGRVIAKAIYDNKQLDCYFTRAFYKHILNVPVRYQDIESEDPSYFKSLEFLLANPVEDLGTELTFSVEVEEFGVRSMRQLKDDGQKIFVTDQNKEDYVQLVCQMKMTGSIRKQLDAFLEGFYQIIPKKLISIFNEQELELLISGLPEIDIDDLCNNTEYKTYNRSSPQIQWFWRALRSFEQEDLAKFLQFVTGTSKVPLQGFSQLEGMNGVQKFTIHMDSRTGERLPSAHTCFNQLDLPKYDNYEQLRRMLLLAIREGSEGFAFA